jgi:hypothetical protein
LSNRNLNNFTSYRYGEEKVLLTTKEKDGFDGLLKEVDNPGVYLHNSEVLFNKYPEIWDKLDTKRLDPYLHKKCGYAQLFMGRQGTGTSFHCASGINWFYMIDGTKKWYFIDPYDSYIASPIFSWGVGAAAYLGLYPDDYPECVMPAFKYCPTYNADLQPGDVLYNPAWWVHGIKNTGEKTVAIASRWLTGTECTKSCFTKLSSSPFYK